MIHRKGRECKVSETLGSAMRYTTVVALRLLGRFQRHARRLQHQPRHPFPLAREVEAVALDGETHPILRQLVRLDLLRRTTRWCLEDLAVADRDGEGQAFDRGHIFALQRGQDGVAQYRLLALEYQVFDGPL